MWDFGFKGYYPESLTNPKSEIPHPKSPSLDMALGCASRLNFGQSGLAVDQPFHASYQPLQDVACGIVVDHVGPRRRRAEEPFFFEIDPSGCDLDGSKCGEHFLLDASRV